MPRAYLPIVPASALRRHRVHQPLDTRFRSAARLLQCLWRAEKALPIGSYVRPNGPTCRLGSMITDKAGERGANFLLPEIARLARREVCYRQPGAFIEERRLWTNLLASTPMTFNLLGPLRLNLRLATKMLRSMFVDLADAVVDGLVFEHSPGRRSIDFTQDGTAFDAMLTYARQDGSRGFIAIETKFSESLNEPTAPLNPRYAELASVAKLHREPSADELASSPVRQFLRQHLLAQATLMRDDFSEGRFIVIAPELNTQVQSGIQKYAGTLVTPKVGQVAFSAISLERMTELLSECGERAYARKFHERYCDWSKIDDVIEAEIAAMESVTAGNDNAANGGTTTASAVA